MAVARKRNLIKKSPPKPQTKKLSCFITIVNKGNGDAIAKLLSHFDVSLTFIHRGEGTANMSVSEILGFNDNRKDVVISIIKKEKLNDIKIEIESFFAAHKRNRGVAFSIPLKAVVGTNTYHFLANYL